MPVITQMCVLAAAILFGMTASLADPPSQHVDLLIRGGTLVEGTGAPRQRADVAVKGGYILMVGTGLKVAAASTVDATGLIVAPGFIDAHNHSGPSLVKPAHAAELDIHLNERYIRQGVTTVVGGPDGETSPSDLRKLLQAYRAAGVGTNVAYYVGHNAIRTEVMGQNQNRAPTAQELERMRALVREGMQAGMVGLSTGLMYSPGLFSEIDEVIALAKEVAPFHGIYESHVRDPHRALLQSDWEAIEIGRQAGIPVDLTHLTTPGRSNRGLMKAVIELVESARRQGVQVVSDQYPYHAVAVMQLWAVLSYPRELNLHTRDEIRAALKDPIHRAQIQRETITGGESGFSHYKASSPSSILILVCPGCESLEGKFISEIASERQVSGFDAIADLLVNTSKDIVVSAGGFFEEDVQILLPQPWNMIASDGLPEARSIQEFSSEHPRSTGTFPRVLGFYVREQKLLTLEEAIRKMTSAPAEFLGLHGRGQIKPGAVADLVVFDPEQISDRSTWKEPGTMPVGVVHVIVNGRMVLKNAVMTGRAPGRYLHRGGATEILEPPHGPN
jgi:N-acyl-D-aspartate/D-glutamate deacylase